MKDKQNNNIVEGMVDNKGVKDREILGSPMEGTVGGVTKPILVQEVHHQLLINL